MLTERGEKDRGRERERERPWVWMGQRMALAKKASSVFVHSAPSVPEGIVVWLAQLER